MTREHAVLPAISLTRIRAVAVVRLRRLARTRRMILATLMAFLPWLLVDQSLLLARLSALTEFTVVALTVLGAGALAEDLDGGQFSIALTHDCTPVEILAGEAAATLLLTILLAAAQLPIALATATAVHLGALLLCLAWLVALLAGWMALMLLAATAVGSVGNAVAMIPLLTIVPILEGSAILDRLPAAAGAVVRFCIQLFPTPHQARRMYESLLVGATAPPLAQIVLLAAPVVYFALAAARLSRLEPAARISA